MHWNQFTIQYATGTDVGRRKQQNEDFVIYQLCRDEQTWENRGHVFVVCDGMGGHAVGDLASKLAAETSLQHFLKVSEGDPVTAMRSALAKANFKVHQTGILNKEFERMGTTCTMLAMNGKGVLIGHVGDSRAYRIRDRRIDQLTYDHSLQWELIRNEKRDPKEVYQNQPKNLITRSLGPSEAVDVDVEGPFPILPGDIYVLCSDGISTYLSDAEIGMLCRYLLPKDACRLMIHIANIRGGLDNASIAIVRVRKSGISSAEIPLFQPKTATGNTEAVDISRRPFPPWVWGLGLLVLQGISCLVFLLSGAYVPSSVLGITSLLTLFATAAWMLKSQRFQRPDQSKPGENGRAGGLATSRKKKRPQEETVFWKPYCTANAVFDQSFFEKIQGTSRQLLELAVRDDWDVDVLDLEKKLKLADEEFERGQRRDALSGYAHVIDQILQDRENVPEI